MRKLALAGLIAAVSLSSACVFALPAIAEPAEPAGAAAAQPGGIVELTEDQYAYTHWEIADDSNLIIKDGEVYSLLDGTGRRLTLEDYGYLGTITGSDNVHYPYYAVAVENGVNNLALIDGNGRRFTEYAYADFFAFSEDWVVAVAITPGDESNSRYKVDGELYAIDHVDIYYKENPIGQVTGEEYAGDFEGEVLGDYLVLYTTTKGYCLCIDPQMNTNTICTIQAVDRGYWSHGDEFYADADGVWRHISGAAAFVPECTLDPATCDLPYLIGGDGLTLFDLQGNVAATMPFVLVDGYAPQGDLVVVRGKAMDGSNRYGIVNAADFSVIVGPEYDEIGYYHGDGETFAGGYARVELNDQFGYIRTDGSVSVPVQYSNASCRKAKGLYSVLQDLDGSYRIVSAEKGLLDQSFSDFVNFEGGYGCPLILVADMDGKWGVIDYLGNTFIPFEYDKSWRIELADDGSFALVQPDGSDSAFIYQYAVAPQAAPAAEAAPVAEQPAEAAPAEAAPVAEQPAEAAPSEEAPADQAASGDRKNIGDLLSSLISSND